MAMIETFFISGFVHELATPDRYTKTSVSDPDPRPDPSDPYVFGPSDPNPDPLVRGMDTAPDPDPSITKQKL
jgi:hypothetical protein